MDKLSVTLVAGLVVFALIQNYKIHQINERISVLSRRIEIVNLDHLYRENDAGIEVGCEVSI